MSDCPRCGCNIYHQIERKRVFGAECDVVRCDHCAHVYRVTCEPREEDAAAPDVSGIIERQVTCPSCGSKRVPTYASKEGTKYRRCKDCDHRFKSIIV